ncbi:MAG: hypothetical protein F6J87_14400 [Spirulina sp. SIO3F2]|nr:hypothetical protein [Spirulina sp. SIO3F2]
MIWGQHQQTLHLGLAVGLALGLGLGLVITQSSGRRAKKFLNLPSWQSLVGSVLLAIAIGAIANPNVFAFYARRVGLEPWHPSYPQVGAAPGFQLYSDRPLPEQDVQIQRFLQEFRAAVGARFLNTGPASCSVDVYLLRNDANYAAILQTFHIKTPFGFFTTITGTPRLFVREGSGLGTLTHEMMHHFVYCTFPQGLPTWVDEGIATLMEKFIAIERNGQLAFSWGYRHHWRDPNIRKVLGTIDLATALQAGRDQDLFNALFLMLYHQQRLAPLLNQLQINADKTGFPTLMATLNLSMGEIQRQWQQWMQTDAFNLPIVEQSFVAWANETASVDRYFREYWQWNSAQQMWLSPRHDPWAVIPAKDTILFNQYLKE